MSIMSSIVSNIEHYVVNKGVVGPDELLLLVARGQIGIYWGKIGSHGCAFKL